MEHVTAALTQRLVELPDSLRQSLTWDQGKELSQHAKVSIDAGIDIYFADPHTPWHRPSNENTNGLLRQYFPKGTDLSGPQRRAPASSRTDERPAPARGWTTSNRKN